MSNAEDDAKPGATDVRTGMGATGAAGARAGTWATGAAGAAGAQAWTFLTNHGHVLVCLASDPELRVRDIAARVGITERATMRILGDLVEAGYLVRRRVGRRNAYALRLDRPMRHPVEAAAPVRALVEAVAAR